MSAQALLPTPSNTPLDEPPEVADPAAGVPLVGRSPTIRRWYWALVPALAVIAYITVLRIGFLSDDYLLLYRSKLEGFNPSSSLAASAFTFFRPLGYFFTWQVGWALF